MSSSLHRSDYRNPIDAEYHDASHKRVDAGYAHSPASLLGTTHTHNYDSVNTAAGGDYFATPHLRVPVAGVVPRERHSGLIGGAYDRVVDAFDRYFELTERGTDVKTEFLAGFSSFLMSFYVVIIIPEFLSFAGLARDEAVVGTCILAAVTSILAGLISDLPFICAPGLGITSYIVYDLLIHQQLPYTTLCTILFTAAAITTLVSALNMVEFVLKPIPNSVRVGLIVGIGLILAFTGLQIARVVVIDADTMTRAASFLTMKAALTAVALLVAVACQYHKKPYGVLLAVLTIAVLHPLYRYFWVHKNDAAYTFRYQRDHVAALPDLHDTFIDNNFPLDFSRLQLSHALLIFGIVGTLLIDMSGAVHGLFRNTHIRPELAELRGVGQPYSRPSDSCVVPGHRALNTIVGLCAMGASLIGLPPPVIFVESNAGIDKGGRTGLTAIFGGMMFLACLFFVPLITTLPRLTSAPLLLLVALTMFLHCQSLDWCRLRASLPAFVTVVITGYTLSYPTAILAGCISYLALWVLTGRFESYLHREEYCPVASVENRI